MNKNSIIGEIFFYLTFVVVFFSILNTSFAFSPAKTDKTKYFKKVNRDAPEPKSVKRTIYEIEDGKIINERIISEANLDHHKTYADIYGLEAIAPEVSLEVEYDQFDRKIFNRFTNHKTSQSRNILSFYDNDLLIKSIHLNKYNDTIAVWYYDYDEKGNLISETERKNQRFERAKWLYLYDENSFLIKAEFYKHNKLVRYTDYSYESQICKCCRKDNNKADCECLMIEKTVTRTNGKVIKKEIKKYNCENQICDVMIYGKAGQNTLHIKNKYNAYGHMSEVYYERKDKSHFLIKYDYEYY